jgi:hypothetical protein
MPNVHAVKPIFTAPVSTSKNTFSHIAEVLMRSSAFGSETRIGTSPLAQPVKVNTLGITLLKEVCYKFGRRNPGPFMGTNLEAKSDNLLT